MRRISYSGGSFLTTDEVSRALLRIVAALGSNHRAEAVDIPIVLDDGGEETVQLVIGPASELVSAHEQTSLAEPDSSEAVAVLTRMADALDRPRPVAAENPGTPPTQFDFDQDL